MSKECERVAWLDIFRGIGIALIVFMHAGNNIGFFSWFVVPLFFFASGYVFKDVEISLFIRKKIKRLYLPFVLANITILLFHNVLYRLGIYTYEISLSQLALYVKTTLMFGIVDQTSASSWFVFAIFIISIVFILIYKATKKLEDKQELAIGVVCSIMCMMGLFTLKYTEGFRWANCAIISETLISILFFMLGWIAKRRQLADKIYGNRKIFGITCATCVIVLTIMRYHKIMKATDYRICNLNNKWLAIIVGIVGIFVVVTLAIFIAEYVKPIGQIFSYIGQRSFSVLLFHVLAFQVVSCVQVLGLGYDSSLLESWIHACNVGYWAIVLGIVGIAVPIGCDFVWESVKKKLSTIKFH